MKDGLEQACTFSVRTFYHALKADLEFSYTIKQVLPLAGEHQGRDRASETRQGSMQATILLIDDNAVQAATRQAILRRAGYFVVCALNPQRALEQLRDAQSAEPVGLVVTDHLMPGMNGAEFVRVLRTFLPEMPVLVISGLDEAEPLYAGLQVTFRLKPLLPEDLLATVARLVRY